MWGRAAPTQFRGKASAKKQITPPRKGFRKKADKKAPAGGQPDKKDTPKAPAGGQPDKKADKAPRALSPQKKESSA